MKILVGLSGGVDSAVSAYTLQQSGHEVEAGFMINYRDPTNPNCTTRKDFEIARQVADFLGIKLHTFNFVDIYEYRILNYVYAEYRKGHTPNPDVFCNNLIKFDVFLERAMEMGFDKIATGHYATLLEHFNTTDKKKVKIGKNYSLQRSPDPVKDQTFFLARLSQYQLSKAMFPIGHLTKSQVREIAISAGLPNADRPDSQGLCFVGKVNMQTFLADHIKPEIGPVLDLDGNQIGTHNGAFYFTIGQNRGLNLGRKGYVVNIDIPNNILTVTYDHQDSRLFGYGVICKDRLGNGTLDADASITCKIRHTQTAFAVRLLGLPDHKMQINFTDPIWSVPKGQVAVCYVNDILFGSGVIESVI